MVGCVVLSGVAPKSLLKLRFRCKASHAEERAAFRIRISAKSIALRKSQSPKKLHGGLRCATLGTPRIPTSLLLFRFRSSAKSIAPCKLHSPKKLHVGCDVLRGVGA